jgi:23S rRNA pseudouridine2605 synthase
MKTNPNAMRLQRFLAQAGVASRRHAEELILDGKVTVNGRVVTELGTKVDARADRVEVEGRPVAQEPLRYILVHKPRGTVTTASDPEGRPTVMELVGDRGARLFPVGRLDFNTEGVLLLTNDGDLAHALMHPSGEIDKTYHVKVRGDVTSEQLSQLRRGVVLPPRPDADPDAPEVEERSGPAEVANLGSSGEGKNTWLEITIHEGRNRQIHRMCEAVGLQVAKLKRVVYAGLTVEGLRPGRWRHLTDEELAAVRALAKVKAPPRPSAPPARRKSAPPTPRARAAKLSRPSGRGRPG